MLTIFLKFGKLSRSFLIFVCPLGEKFPAWASHSWSRPTRPRTVGEYEYCLLPNAVERIIKGHQSSGGSRGTVRGVRAHPSDLILVWDQDETKIYNDRIVYHCLVYAKTEDSVFRTLWLATQSVNILHYSLIHLQLLRASDAKLA